MAPRNTQTATKTTTSASKRPRTTKKEAQDPNVTSDAAPEEVAIDVPMEEVSAVDAAVDVVADIPKGPDSVDAADEEDSNGVESEPAKLHEIAKQIHKLQRTMNKTQRTVNSILQNLEGVDPKMKKKGRVKKEPSGFAKPSLLSDELCDFLMLPRGSKLARTEVTKRLTTYIKERELQNPQNRRQILLDDRLKKLLLVPEGTVVTFFNIQKFLSHYKQDVATEEAQPAPVPPPQAPAEILAV